MIASPPCHSSFADEKAHRGTLQHCPVQTLTWGRGLRSYGERVATRRQCDPLPARSRRPKGRPALPQRVAWPRYHIEAEPGRSAETIIAQTAPDTSKSSAAKPPLVCAAVCSRVGGKQRDPQTYSLMALSKLLRHCLPFKPLLADEGRACREARGAAADRRNSADASLPDRGFALRSCPTPNGGRLRIIPSG
jgi:hypothetical protein